MCVRPQACLRAGVICLFLWFVATAPAAAQTPPPPQPSAGAPTLPPQLPGGPLTLEDVLAIAAARSEGIAIAEAGVSRADASRVQARSGLFPQLSVSGSYDRALASEFEGVFTSTGPTCAPFSLNQAAALDARLSELERAVDCGAVGSNLFGGSSAETTDDSGLGDLPFGRKNTWRATLSFSQNVWSGGRNGAQIALAAAGRSAADLAVRTATGQLSFDATQAFYEAALSARLVEIAQATLEQADATLRQVQAGFDAGTQPEFEVLRARVNRDNQTPLLIRQRVNSEVALLRLKQLLDLPATFNLQITENLRDESLAPPAPFAPRVAEVEKVMQNSDFGAVIAQGLAAPLPRRAAVDAAETDLVRTQAALKLTEAQKMPSVSINSSYGRVAYPAGALWDWGSLRTNWTVGASVQVPILTGGRQRGDELSARADVQESRARLQQTQELAGLDTRLAWAELFAARATWEATAGTVQQAQRAYEIADVRYRAGVSTQLELSDARLLLQQAEANRAQAARDVQVARARVALLPELPLSGITAAAAPAAARTQPQTNQTTQTGGSSFQTTGTSGTQTQVGR